MFITYISDDFLKAKNKLIRVENTDDSCITDDNLSNAKEKRRIKCHKQFNTTELSQNQRNKKLFSLPRKLILKKKMQKKSSQMGSFNTLSLPAVPLGSYFNSHQSGKL